MERRVSGGESLVAAGTAISSGSSSLKDTSSAGDMVGMAGDGDSGRQRSGRQERSKGTAIVDGKGHGDRNGGPIRWNGDTRVSWVGTELDGDSSSHHGRTPVRIMVVLTP